MVPAQVGAFALASAVSFVITGAGDAAAYAPCVAIAAPALALIIAAARGRGPAAKSDADESDSDDEPAPPFPKLGKDALVAFALLCACLQALRANARAAPFRESVARFRGAATADPSDAAAWRGLGAALTDGGDEEGAIDAYGRAAALFPDAAPPCGLAALRPRPAPAAMAACYEREADAAGRGSLEGVDAVFGAARWYRCRAVIGWGRPSRGRRQRAGAAKIIEDARPRTMRVAAAARPRNIHAAATASPRPVCTESPGRGKGRRVASGLRRSLRSAGTSAAATLRARRAIYYE